MNQYIPASNVQVGDTLRFGDSRLEITIERISEAQCDGAVGLHGNNETWSSFYKPTDRVPVIRFAESNECHVRERQ